MGKREPMGERFKKYFFTSERMEKLESEVTRLIAKLKVEMQKREEWRALIDELKNCLPLEPVEGYPRWLANLKQRAERAASGGEAVSNQQQLREALEELADQQNGPPLIRHAKRWNEAMAQACEALGRTDGIKHYREAAEAAGKAE